MVRDVQRLRRRERRRRAAGREIDGRGMVFMAGLALIAGLIGTGLVFSFISLDGKPKVND